jgi:NAD(P)-dependent dehydrogenase (short-subunit alcohol dehydrogenase family)
VTEIHRIPADYQPAADLLRDRIILVTGAGAGIGRAVAIACARHGATVILLGKTVAHLEETYDAIEQAGGPQPAIYPFNLATAAVKEYTDLHDTLSREFGRLDGVLLNAGVLGERKSVEQTSVEDWDLVMQVNVTANFLLTRSLLPLLRQSDAGSLLFTSSSVGRKGRAYWGAYAVSKFAVEGLTQVLADELENISAIRVNAINPGATNTEMRRKAYPGEEPSRNPLPEEIVTPYLYLLGPASAGITGKSFDAQPPR